MILNFDTYSHHCYLQDSSYIFQYLTTYILNCKNSRLLQLTLDTYLVKVTPLDQNEILYKVVEILTRNKFTIHLLFRFFNLQMRIMDKLQVYIFQVEVIYLPMPLFI